MALIERERKHDDRPLSEASRLAWFMGLPRWKDVDDLGLVERVTKGLPAGTAEIIVNRIDPAGHFVKATHIIPKTTLHRRSGGALSKDDSERLLMLARVFSEVLRLYHGDTERAAAFLSRPHPMLGDRPPIALATSSMAGAELVLKLLARADASIAA